jgi:putative heme-binding domain-containing protein
MMFRSRSTLRIPLRPARRGVLRLPATVATLAVVAVLAASPFEAAGQGNRAGAPQAARGAGAPAESGTELFATTCKVCHGEAGIGGVGPALRGEQFTRAYVRRAMSEGRPGSMMPEFTRTFTAAQMNQVSEYVASLQSPEGPAPAGLRGNPVAGEAAFFSRGARSCYVCHAVGGRGGTVGPELTAKVAALSAREIFQRIIVVPHRSSDPAYSTTRLTTKVGMILTGIKAGETDDVVRFYDTSSLPPILRTIPKADIVESAAHDASVMPSDYASRLTLQQLLDIVSFLKSSAGGPRVSVALSDVIR